MDSLAGFLARRTPAQLEAWTHLADRYLTWIEIIAEL
jgi:hypothetical protein